MEQTHCGRGIDIKQRQGTEQITIYTGRTDDRGESTHSQRTVNAQSPAVRESNSDQPDGLTASIETG